MADFKKVLPVLNKGARWSRAILNGVVGDTLHSFESRLAIPMTLFYNHRPLILTHQGLAGVPVSTKGEICVLIHGSCSFEAAWDFKKTTQNYGTQLQNDYGLTPFFVCYNSGLHISTNGKELALLLEKLVRHSPVAIKKIVLIGHSMGGLMIRSACHVATQEQQQWLKHVTKIFYLGTPHLGAPLEKMGHVATTVLQKIPNITTRVIAKMGNWRSAGIKDLRHGYITDEAWQNHERALFYDEQKYVPLYPGAEHHLICGTISKIKDSKAGRIFGDGMVSPASASGLAWFSGKAIIPFDPQHSVILEGVSHYQLQNSPRVYEHIKEKMRS